MSHDENRRFIQKQVDAAIYELQQALSVAESLPDDDDRKHELSILIRQLQAF